MMTLAVSSWMIDVRSWRTGTLPAVVFGSNPLVAFVGSGILARILVLVQVDRCREAGPPASNAALYEGFFVPLAGPVNGSFLFALTTVFFGWEFCGFFTGRRLFIKI